jgi:CHASE2 domain-containing sensor protein
MSMRVALANSDIPEEKSHRYPDPDHLYHHERLQVVRVDERDAHEQGDREKETNIRRHTLKRLLQNLRVEKENVVI